MPSFGARIANPRVMFDADCLVRMGNPRSDSMRNP